MLKNHFVADMALYNWFSAPIIPFGRIKMSSSSLTLVMTVHHNVL